MIRTSPPNIGHVQSLEDVMSDLDRHELDLFGCKNHRLALEFSMRSSKQCVAFVRDTEDDSVCWAMFGIMEDAFNEGTPWLICTEPEHIDRAMTRVLVKTIRREIRKWFRTGGGMLRQRMWLGAQDHMRLVKTLGFEISEPAIEDNVPVVCIRMTSKRSDACAYLH